MVDNKDTKVHFADNKKVQEFQHDNLGIEVDVIPGKIVSILGEDTKTGEKYLLDDPKVVIGKRKGLLAALGILNKRKYIGIIDQHGNYIKDRAAIKELLNKIKGREFADTDGKKLGTFNIDATLPKNLTIPMDDNLIVYKDGKLAGIKRGDELQDQYGSSLYQDQIVQKGSKNYIIEDTARNIDTKKGVANLAKAPSKSAMKGSREAAKKEAQQIGADLLRKQASPKERAKEDRKVARDIATKARISKRARGLWRIKYGSRDTTSLLIYHNSLSLISDLDWDIIVTENRRIFVWSLYLFYYFFPW